jgi:hypothetical protein
MQNIDHNKKKKAIFSAENWRKIAENCVRNIGPAPASPIMFVFMAREKEKGKKVDQELKGDSVP